MKVVIVDEVYDDLNLSDIRANVELFPINGTVNGEPFYVKHHGFELRPLPKKMPEVTPNTDWEQSATIYSQGFHDGWNACIDEILGDCITQEEADCCGVQFWHDD